MQIVIEIDEHDWNEIQELTEDEKDFHQRVISDGTPLPKGHGRLIDADDAIETLKSLGNRDYRREKGTIQEAEKILSFDEYTQTIIEADKQKARAKNDKRR